MTKAGRMKALYHLLFVMKTRMSKLEIYDSNTYTAENKRDELLLNDRLHSKRNNGCYFSKKDKRSEEKNPIGTKSNCN